METIPPTQNALLQHTQRAAYQAGIWTTSNYTNLDTPSPEGHGWPFDTSVDNNSCSFKGMQ